MYVLLSLPVNLAHICGRNLSALTLVMVEILTKYLKLHKIIIMWYNYINLLLQSLILHSPKVSVLIHGLFGFTHYYFYLLVQYGNTTTFGTYSKAAVQTVMTSVLGE